MKKKIFGSLDDHKEVLNVNLNNISTGSFELDKINSAAIFPTCSKSTDIVD